MLRVMNLKSPMSSGMWVLSVYAALSFICMCLAAAGLATDAPAIAEVRTIIAGIGLAPALFVGSYKGVMLSATAQPAWKDLRWLGAELVSSAALMGVAGLLMVALFLPVLRAVPGLALAQKVLLFVNLAFTLHYFNCIIRTVWRKHAYFRILGYTLLLAAVWILPLILSFLGGVEFLAAAACLILSGTLILRLDLIMLPHRIA
jgi:hypothetical protein